MSRRHNPPPPPPVHPPSFYQPTIYYNSPVSMNPAGDNAVLIGFAGGIVYSLNPDTGAVTQLEQLNLASSNATGGTGLVYWVGGFANNRMVSYDAEAGDRGNGAAPPVLVVDNTAMAIYSSDTEVAPGTTSASVESSIWDFDLPEQRKILDGFSIVCDIPTGAENVEVEYQIDQDGEWTSAGVIDLTATGLYHFIPVSDSANSGIEFSTLQFRTSVFGTPFVYSVTAQARIADFEETWTVLLRLTDDKYSDADEKRDDLWTIVRGKKVVEFVDAYPSRKTGRQATPTGGSSTYSVTITGLEDFIDFNGQGKAKVELRRVVTDRT